jgi:type III pantothenate kinase
MNLVLDLGNSRCKWALARPPGMAEVRSAKPSVNEASFTGQTQEQVFRNDALAPGGVFAYGENFVHTLDAAFGGLARPERVAAVCVASAAHTEALAHWVQSHWGLDVQRIVACAAQLGVTNSYKDPTRLGADRWAALIAARARHTDAVCVVDCGTALTVDALDSKGVFRGGVILPGLALMRDALLRRTQGVRDAQGDEGSVFAQTTADGVVAGTLFGLVGAIDRILDEQAAMLGVAPQVLITGGDAQPVLALLRHAHQHVPDLVLEGVAHIVRTGDPP